MNILYDTDFLINLFVTNESNHKKAITIKNKVEFAYYNILNLVTYEFATVLSRKFDQDFALSILTDFEKIKNLEIIYLNKTQEEKVWNLFKGYSKKNISFVDCANLVIAQEFNLKIASFDKFYPKELLINNF